MMVTRLTIEDGVRVKKSPHHGTEGCEVFYITQRSIQYKVRSGIEGAGYLPHAMSTAMIVSWKWKSLRCTTV